MVILFDKNVDQSITAIRSGDVDGDKFYFHYETTHGWVIDSLNFIIRVGADDTYIQFISLDAMIPYINQYEILSVRIVNPFTDGIRTDPYYDKPKTGNIVSHTYTNTDVEKELIQRG